jgi:hypothetical protein
LSSNEVSEVQRQYEETVEEYTKITTEYDNAAKRATNSHEKSLFPGKDCWNPPGRILSTFERELLIGPLRDVSYFKKLTVRDKTTNRAIEYSCINIPFLPSEIPKQSSSFILVPSESHTIPLFGAVTSLFVHTFAKKNCFWALVHQFPTPVYDHELKMWHVSVQESECDGTTNLLVIQLDKLSYPLVVAFDNNLLWILNTPPNLNFVH